MKHIFIIVDCSGSIISDDITKVAQINDLIADLIHACLAANNENDIRVICYANKAKVYWQSSLNRTFYEIPESKFADRSNLGEAYKLIYNEMIINETIEICDCIIVLISDGEATDNYKRALNELDPNNDTIRIALSVGNSTHTTERHSLGNEFCFKNGVKDRDAFIAKIVDNI